MNPEDFLNDLIVFFAILFEYYCIGHLLQTLMFLPKHKKQNESTTYRFLHWRWNR